MTSLPAEDSPAPAPPRGTARREVMLVEDSLDYAQAVKAMLDYAEGESFDVRHFTRVAEAAEHLPDSDTCCVLLDLNLPDATGVEAVCALRAVAPEVPIVVLSGTDDDQVALDAMHEGAQDYLVKGRADVDLITRSIRYAMERASSERQRIALLREQAARAEAETLAAQAFQQEHETAVTLQRALLPDRLPDVPGLALAARYLPGAAGAEVGGDWYDVIPLADGRVGVAMGDVVGRGIPAASLMGQLRNALRAYAVEGHPPGRVIERLDRLTQSLNPGRMATLLYMVLEPGWRSACFANAGHLPVLMVEPGRPPQLLDGTRGVPLGVLRYASFDEATATIPPGATLVLFTDGLVEVRGVSIELRLDELRRIAATPFEGPNELCERLLTELLPEGPGVDDVAVLALTTAPASSDRLSLTLPAEPEALITARRALRNWLIEMGADPEALYDITLATGEACTNAIEHAYAPGDASFDLEATRGDSEIHVVVRDYGQWRPPRGQNRGRGLKLMETLMDAVELRRDPTGTTVEMRRHIAPEDA